MLSEEWRSVVGYEGLYEVSNLGDVRSFYNGRVLRPYRSRSHYVVSLHRGGNGRGKDRRVHHLVLEAFVGPRPVGMECRHFPDRDTANNRVDNLLWGTRKENCADREVQGTSQRGEGNATAKLSNKDIEDIRQMAMERSLSQSAIALRYNVSQSLVSRIASRDRWTHL